MADDLDRISKYLALNLVELRKKRRLSQQGLAALSGLPRSTLAYLESGEGNPSLQNLAKLANSLQVSIEELLSRPRLNVKLLKQSDVPKIRKGHGVLIHKLLPDEVPGMAIERMEFEVGAKMGGTPHVSGTKEYLVCLAGSVELRLSGESYELSAGDVLAFPGDQPHAYWNTGRGKTVCFSVVVLSPAGL